MKRPLLLMIMSLKNPINSIVKNAFAIVFFTFLSFNALASPANFKTSSNQDPENFTQILQNLKKPTLIILGSKQCGLCRLWLNDFKKIAATDFGNSDPIHLPYTGASSTRYCMKIRSELNVIKSPLPADLRGLGRCHRTPIVFVFDPKMNRSIEVDPRLIKGNKPEVRIELLRSLSSLSHFEKPTEALEEGSR